MATDLSDLSELEPGANDPVSAGDDEIRKTRLHTKNWADVQHHLTGEHQFPTGTTLPGAGKVNQLFLNTSDEVVYRDTGSSWTLLRTNQYKSSFIGGTLALDATSQTLASVTVVIPVGGRLIVFASSDFSIPSSGRNVNQGILSVEFDGSPINVNHKIFLPDANITVSARGFWAIDSPATGSKSVVLKGSLPLTPSGVYNAVSRHLVAVVL